MYWVTKEIRFESAHRLVNGYQGKCANVHGHSWVARFTIKSDQLDQYGFVRDFSDFATMKSWIDQYLDHACMVNENDKELLSWLHQHGQKNFVCKGNPTSEYLTQMLCGVAKALGLDCCAVEINETCTSCARYEP